MNNLVSIIIPTYNRHELLRRAIKSVLAQTYENYEILVVNDSKNKKPVIDVIEGFANDRLRYFNNERVKGGNGARNTGILRSKGDYISFLDDDDEWLPAKLQNQINHLSQNSIYGGVLSAFFLQKKDEWIVQNYDINLVKIEDILTSRVRIGSSSNLLFSRNAFDSIGLWDEDLKRQQDLELLVRFLNKYKMAYDPNVGIKVYGHNPPNSQILFKEREKYFLKVQKYVVKLNTKDRKKYYSLHFRRQIECLVKLKEYKIGWEYYKYAVKYEIFHFNKDLKNFLLLIKSFFRF